MLKDHQKSIFEPIEVLCIKSLQFNYKSWGQEEGNKYIAHYTLCYYCGNDTCNENIWSKHQPSYKIEGKYNDFCNVPIDTFYEHFKTKEQIREDKINSILNE